MLAQALLPSRGMKIACSDVAACAPVLGVLQRHGVTRSVSWEGGMPLDARMWIVVNAALASDEEQAIRHDIDSIVGAAVQV